MSPREVEREATAVEMADDYENMKKANTVTHAKHEAEGHKNLEKGRESRKAGGYQNLKKATRVQDDLHQAK